MGEAGSAITSSFVTDAKTAKRLSWAWVRRYHGRSSLWLMYAGAWLLLIGAAIFGPSGERSIAVELSFGAIVMSLWITYNATIIYFRTKRSLHRSHATGEERHSVFGVEGCTFATADAETYIRYSAIDGITRSGPAAFLQIRGQKFPSFVPVELVPPAALARFREATMISLVDEDSAAAT